MITTKKVDLLQ